MATGSTVETPPVTVEVPVTPRTLNFTMMTPPATIGTEMPVPGSDPPGIEPVAAPTAAPTRQPLINPLITAEQVRISELECMVQQLRADLLLLKVELTKPEYTAPK